MYFGGRTRGIIEAAMSGSALKIADPAGGGLSGAAPEPVAILRDWETDAIAEAIKDAGWIERADALLKEERRQKKADPRRMIHVIDQVITSATAAIERYQFGISVSDDEGKSNYPIDYYRQPILTARKIEGANFASPLQAEALDNTFTELGLIRPPSFIVPRLEDLEQIGGSAELLAMMFWAEIQSIHSRQREWGAVARYDAIAAMGTDEDQSRAALLKDAVGANIHGLRAKDSTGRWAYYHVYVPTKDEMAFMNMFGGAGSFDLDQLGVVVQSIYEDAFREHQKKLAHAVLAPIFDRYFALAQRQRSYSYLAPTPASKQTRTGFHGRRFDAAARDEGSRQALAEALVLTTEKNGYINDPNALPAVATFPYERRLLPDAAAAMAKLVEDRHLGAADIAFVIRLLTRPSREDVETLLGTLRPLTRYVGDDDAAMYRFLVLICQNRGFINGQLLAVALDLAAKKNVLRAGATFLSMVPMALGLTGLAAAALTGFALNRLETAEQRVRRELGGMAWEDALRGLAACDMLVSSLGPLRDDFLSRLADYAYAPDQDAAARDRACTGVVDLLEERKGEVSEPKPEFEGAEAIDAAGVQLGLNIVRRIVKYHLGVTGDASLHKLMSKIIETSFIRDIQAISCFGFHIERYSPERKRTFIEGVLRNSLAGLFEENNYPLEKREKLVGDLAAELIAYDLRQAEEKPAVGAWSAGVLDERAALAGRALPDKAPVLWKDAKAFWASEKARGNIPHNEDLNPPNFIKRVYGPWLREDATGLTRPDLKRLDREERPDGSYATPLYSALTNWLRNNELPTDCPLPTKTERISREVEQGLNPDSQSASEWRRLYAAQWRARQKRRS
jgi:hypothetical protein